MKKYIIIGLIGLFVGCTTNGQKEYDLLYREGLKNIAYKSITIKDVIGEEEFN